MWHIEIKVILYFTLFDIVILILHTLRKSVYNSLILFSIFCREQQLELKKWEVKQAEKQRVVKLSSADWADHPDRYLLELGGRQSYNTPSN